MRPNLGFLLVLIAICAVGQAQTKLLYVHSADSINKGIEFHDEGKFEEAVKLYSYVLPGDTNYGWAVYEKCLSLVSDEKYEEGIALAEEGLSLKDENEGLFYNLLGTSYDDLDQKDKALEIYAKAIERFPMDYNLYYNRAIVHLKYEEGPEAYEDLKTAVGINPYHASSHLALAKLALNQEQYAQALLAFGYYLNLEPTGERANASLVMINNAVSDKVELEPMEFGLENTDAFKKTNLLITSYAALRKDYKVPSKISIPFISQLHLAVDQGVKMKKRSGFWQNYYLPFYDEIMEKGDFEPMSYRLMASSGSPKHQKTINKNSKNVIAYIERIGPMIRSMYSLHHLDFDENKEEVKFWRYEKGNAIEARGKVNDEGSPTGDYQFFYTNGSVSSEGKYNEKGEREGEWKYYHRNGALSGTNLYSEGKLNGADVDYSEKGVKLVESGFKDNERDGKTLVYNETGDLNRSMYHNAGKIQDSLVYYYVNGQVERFLPMKEGNVDGKSLYYFQDGTKMGYYMWKEDKRDGEFELLFPDGTLSVKGTYKAGELDGPYLSNYSNGKTHVKGNYVDGVRVGKWEEFFFDGKPKEVAVYDEKGKTTGTKEIFDYNGHKVTTFEYLKGEIIEYKHYDRDGNIQHEDKRKKGRFWFENYTLDGVKDVEGYYAGDHKEGTWKYYTENGVLSGVEEFNDKGELIGEDIAYHPNGKLKSKTLYQDGELHGYGVSYYDNGQIEEQGYYWNNEAYGQWISYEEDGRLSAVNFYVADKYNGPQYWYNEAGELYLIEHFEMGTLVKLESCNADSSVHHSWERKMPEGVHIKYYPNGQKAYELPMIGGAFNGKGQWWYGHGQLQSEGMYLSGDRHGEWKWYHPNGKLRTVGTYSFGDRVGEWKGYHDNGQLDYVTPYEGGKRHGEHKSYYRDGKLESIINYFQGEMNGKRYFHDYKGKVDHIRYYDQGRIIGYAYLSTDGKEVDMIPIARETAEVTSYFQNGKVSRKYQLKNGLFQGDYFEYNDDGSERYHSVYVDDNREGKVVHSYGSGAKKSEATYVNGLMNGEFIEYHTNGQPKLKTQYVNGVEHGLRQEFDKNGKLTNQYEYQGGELYKKI